MPQKNQTPALFVAVPSPLADDTAAWLRSIGLDLTRADNICLAEIYADAQPFELAVFDCSLRPQEQLSLARVMRIRWPWIRIICWLSSPGSSPDATAFDCSAHSASQLAACIEKSLLR